MEAKACQDNLDHVLRNSVQRLMALCNQMERVLEDMHRAIAGFEADMEEADYERIRNRASSRC